MRCHFWSVEMSYLKCRDVIFEVSRCHFWSVEMSFLKCQDVIFEVSRCHFWSVEMSFLKCRHVIFEVSRCHFWSVEMSFLKCQDFRNSRDVLFQTIEIETLNQDIKIETPEINCYGPHDLQICMLKWRKVTVPNFLVQFRFDKPMISLFEHINWTVTMSKLSIHIGNKLLYPALLGIFCLTNTYLT